MKRVYFENMENVAAFLIEEASDGKDVTAAYYYDEACEILKELARYDVAQLVSLNLHDCLWDNYSDEYYIELSPINDGYINIFVEPGKHDGKYLGFEADTLLLCPDAHFEIAKRNELAGAEVVESVFSEDCDITKDECDLEYRPKYESCEKESAEQDDDTFCDAVLNCYVNVDDNITAFSTDFHLTFDQVLELIRNL